MKTMHVVAWAGLGLLAVQSSAQTLPPGTGTGGINTNSSGGQAEAANIINTGSSRGRIELDFDPVAIPDSIHIYCPPRSTNRSRRIYDWNGSGMHPIRIRYAGNQAIEIVINEGSGELGTYWDYAGTIYPAGGRPIQLQVGSGGRGTGITLAPRLPKVTVHTHTSVGKPNSAGPIRSRVTVLRMIGFGTQMIRPLPPQRPTPPSPASSARNTATPVAITSSQNRSPISLTMHIQRMSVMRFQRISLRAGRNF